MPAVVVPVAVTMIRSMRLPLAAAVKTVPSVPVPSLFALALEIATIPVLGDAAYWGVVDI